MKKKALRFGRQQQLVGVVHAAESSSQGSAQTWGALLWNTGISNRNGPFGVNQEIARLLAARGITSLCFDLSRLGDSDDSGEKISIQDRNSRDIGDAVELLCRDYGVGRVLLIGLCSSAVDAYYYARGDERVGALVMVDSFVYSTPRHEWLVFAQKVTSPARWRRFIGRKLRRLFAREEPEASPAVDYFEPNYPAPDAARDALTRMLARDVRMLVIYTGGFAPFFSHRGQFAAMLGAKDFGPRLRVERWPETDHLFTMLEDRQKFLNSLTAWLDSALARDEAPLALPQRPEEEAQSKSAEATEEAAALNEILGVYRRLLAPTPLGPDDHFFEAGGSSLQAIKAATELTRLVGRPVSPVDIYSAVRPRELARLLCARPRSASPAPSPVSASHETPAAPFQAPAPLPSDAGPGVGIAIIGIACRVPGAQNWREFWELVLEGRVSVSRFAPHELDPSLPRELKTDPAYSPARGIIEGDRFDHAFFGIHKSEALLLDPQQRVLLETAWQALEDAGYSQSRSQHRIAVYAGVGSNTYLARNIMQGHAQPHSSREFAALLANDKDYVATRIAHTLNLKGPAVSVHTACSTSLVAVIEAAKTLLCGDAELAIAGAAAVNSPLHSGHLYQEGSIFSRDGRCLPFSQEASGTMFSDGAAVVVLKKLDAARRDGDHIYAVIQGWGLNNDGREKSSFAAPSVQGQAEVIQSALARAGWSAASLGYIEAHGTATPIGDPIEVEGLRRGLGTPEKSFCALGSVKANIGHLTAAAGTIGLIKAALALKFGKIPEAVGAWPVNPGLQLENSPFYLPQKTSDWPAPQPRRAGVSSFGVGGTNAHVLLEAPAVAAGEPLRDPRESEIDPWIILPYGARDPNAAERLGTQLARYLPQARPELKAWAAHLQTSRELHSVQRACVARDHAGLLAAFAQPHPSQTLSTAHGKKPLILLFPGQGTQYPKMGLGLAAMWPRFAQHYNFSLDSYERLNGLDVRAALSSVDESRLQDTLLTQASLFCFEWSLAKTFMEGGLSVQGMIGHSLGEIVAATLAAVFSWEDGLRLVHARGQAMAAAPEGAMLAVRASRDQIEPWLSAGSCLAAHNGPEALVISGSLAAIAALEERLVREKIATRRLRSAHAFHSPSMDPVLPAWSQALERCTLHAPQLPIWSTVTGRMLRPEEATSRAYWIEQLRGPVRFMEALQSSLTCDPLYLELGPRRTLSQLAQQIAPAQPAHAVCSGSHAASEEASCAETLGALWLAGHRPFADEMARRETAPPPPYPFYGEKLWLAPLESKEPAPPLTDERPADAVARLRRELADFLGVESAAIDPERSWSELGLDSLMLTQWSLRLQKEFGLSLHLGTLQGERPNLNALAALLPSVSQSPGPVLLRGEAPRSTGKEAPMSPQPPKIDLSAKDMVQIMEQQLRLMEQQLEIMRSFMGEGLSGKRSSGSESAHHPSWLESRLRPSEIEIYSDRGPSILPELEGAFLAKDPSGQPALYIENPEAPGEFWQVVAA